MLRLHFSADDLLRVAFVPAPAPMMELALAVAQLQRPPRPCDAGRWQQAARRAFPVAGRPLLDLVPASGAGPMFLDPVSPDFGSGLDLVLHTPAATIRTDLDHVCPASRPVTPFTRALVGRDSAGLHLLESALRTTWTALLAHQWPRIEAAHDAELAWRTRILAHQGLHTALAGLVPGGHWESSSTLAYDRPGDVDVRLTGHGLRVLPSVLWKGRPIIAHHTDAPSVLIYPTAAAPLRFTGEDEPDDPLGTLLGSTRAAVLHLLTAHRTTTEIARALDISKASASEHARALRHARLITSRRAGKAVFHTCSSLGLQLLTSTDPPPAPPRGARFDRRPQDSTP
ncbi:ArsR family transcriptional regulator [Streptomyces sp. 1114.5]|uniref:ArsR/SmtB family transcription factor n=1 Tax=unclassified Streptomyces TaxID=2593676 RepID=UPI000BC858FF|nr:MULTISPECIES: winged helix-turn-helix domain-containing protein [unclassified Streptomyces]RKT09778.1 ArsR family transcriptional regulator [Streptomyces sp. 1114.5]SOB88872.1 transcriptional regulator, ArsR family [Streptomyces sp. 1331.2]